MGNIIKNKRYRIFLLSTILGIVLTSVEYILIRIMMIGTNEWTLEMGDFIFYTTFILILGAILLIALFFLKDMSRREIVKSSLGLVIYYIIFLIFERLVFGFGYDYFYQLYIWLLYPIRIYSSITQLLIRLGFNIWISVAFSIPLPFIFVLFARKKEGDKS